MRLVSRRKKKGLLGWLEHSSRTPIFSSERNPMVEFIRRHKFQFVWLALTFAVCSFMACVSPPSYPKIWTMVDFNLVGLTFAAYVGFVMCTIQETDALESKLIRLTPIIVLIFLGFCAIGRHWAVPAALSVGVWSSCLCYFFAKIACRNRPNLP
jgi:hypothetical protein